MYLFVVKCIFVLSLIFSKRNQKNHTAQCHLEFWRKIALMGICDDLPSSTGVRHSHKSKNGWQAEFDEIFWKNLKNIAK